MKYNHTTALAKFREIAQTLDNDLGDCDELVFTMEDLNIDIGSKLLDGTITFEEYSTLLKATFDCFKKAHHLFPLAAELMEDLIPAFHEAHGGLTREERSKLIPKCEGLANKIYTLQSSILEVLIHVSDKLRRTPEDSDEQGATHTFPPAVEACYASNEWLKSLMDPWHESPDPTNSVNWRKLVAANVRTLTEVHEPALSPRT